MKKFTRNFRQTIRWYPVSSVGWVITIFYIGLVVYLIVEVNRHLYTTSEVWFRVSILCIAVITMVMVWARIRGERPFAKKNERP